VRGVQDDSSHRHPVPEKAVTVKKVTTAMEHGTPAIKADIEGVERSLIIDTGSDVSILKPGISNANIRDTALRSLWGDRSNIRGERPAAGFTGFRWAEVRSHVFSVSAAYGSSRTTRYFISRRKKCPHKFRRR
jgi:hypothetical protein